MQEFDLIKKYFTKNYSRPDVKLSIGDDAAIIIPPANQELIFTVDTLVNGVHFPIETLPFDIGYKTAAVNLSDLAAMGAKPLWATLALTLPAINENWLTEFSRGLFTLLNQYEVALIGGDTTRGPLTITLQIQGCVPPNQAIRRDAAQAGDLIYVSGTLGDAGLGLQLLQNNQFKISATEKEFLLSRLNLPTPRVELGLLARNFASAAIDISDGFAQDLQHILQSSEVGAEVELSKLPLSTALANHLPPSTAWNLALSNGDDYELCLTVPAAKAAEFETACKKINCAISCVGKITLNKKLILLDPTGNLFNPSAGYQHF